jgi:glucose/arabinose dehydrogenase
MLKRALTVLGAACVAGACAAPVAMAAGTPLTVLPVAPSGHKVSMVATGLQVPTAFAFGDGQLFEGDGTQSRKPGGVYVLKSGSATLLPGSPGFVAGLAWHKGTLYVSAATFTSPTTFTSAILAWSGWNGTKFTQQKVLYAAPKGFPGFNGLAVGPDGRLYAGVDVSLSRANDHGPATAPYQYDILSFDLKTGKPTVFATGIRQPWQMAFAPGDRDPFVTDLGQDTPKGIKVPDFLLHVKAGDNFGFPTCNGVSAKACKGFAKPFKSFVPHTDVGGIAIVGKKLYLTEFGYVRRPLIVSIPLRGGRPTTVVSHIPGHVIGLGAHNGWLYFGVVSSTGVGTVYRVHT